MVDSIASRSLKEKMIDTGMTILYIFVLPFILHYLLLVMHLRDVMV
jgi:hypothetical protein